MLSEDIKRFYNEILSHSNETELRVLNKETNKMESPEHWTNEKGFVNRCKYYNGTHNIYVGIHERTMHGTQSKDVICVKRIAIDVDAIHPKDEAATNEELEKASKVVSQICYDFILKGYKEPVVIMTGNGFTIWFGIPKIEITNENRDKIQTKLKMFEKEIIDKYSDDINANIDVISDLARIIKVPGTMSVKGSNTEDRPHRLAHFESKHELKEDQKLKDYILSLEPKEEIKTIVLDNIGLDDDKLKELTKNDKKLRDLMNGDWKQYKFKSRSEAEQSLVTKLILAGCNKEQVFSAMNQCKIGKWKEKTSAYHDRTYDNSLKASRSIEKENKKENIIKELENDINPEYTEDLKHEVMELLVTKQRDTATEVIVKKIHKKFKIYTTRDDEKAEVWIYNNGIYESEGKSFIKEFCRIILGKAHTTHLGNNIIDKIIADTYINQSDFFNQNYLEEIAVKNGILNVVTKKLTPFTPDKIFFNKIPIVFDPKKKCPTIKAHFEAVLKHKEDIPVIEEIFGYFLYKDYPIEKSIMCSGYGRNGKSKTMELMKLFIGSANCVSIPIHDLENDQYAMGELFKKMANLCGEIDSRSLKQTSKFKSLTGRDEVSAPRKFKPRVSFKNYAKMVFLANQLPVSYDDSDAFWNRWVPIEFPFKFLSQKEIDKLSDDDKKLVKLCDKDIVSKLTTDDELSGLLNVALVGLNRLLKQGDFSHSRSVEQIKTFWLRKSCSFTSFIMDCCNENPDEYEKKSTITRSYADYCKKYKLKRVGTRRFKWVMESMGVFDSKKRLDDSTVWIWEGIELKNVNDITKNQGDVLGKYIK